MRPTATVKMSRAIACSLCLLVLFSALTSAALPPPEPPAAAISWEPKSKTRLITNLAMGTINLQFEETTLGTIADLIGLGRIEHQGDASESIYWLCYTTPTERLWIIAHGEMGGPEHRITEVAARSQSSAVATADCPALPTSFQPVSLNGELWLGPKKDLLKRLGEPSHIEGQWRAYNFEGTEPGNCRPQGFDVLNWLWVLTDKGRVTAIHAGQVTSC